MKPNVGHPLDKGLRIVVGLVLLSLIFFIDGPMRWVGLIGIVPIVTVFIRWCPGWALLGVDTTRHGRGSGPGHPTT